MNAHLRRGVLDMPKDERTHSDFSWNLIPNHLQEVFLEKGVVTYHV